MPGSPLAGLLLAGLAGGSAPTAGPLVVHPTNPRWVADSRGRARVLTGSHTWCSIQDLGPTDPPPAFDWDRYLHDVAGRGHNFIRLWRWELTRWRDQHEPHAVQYASPHPWPRVGPGLAADGRPKFDLSRFDPAYFQRLRARAEAAAAAGAYVSIMLFEGWGMQFAGDAWTGHPFHPDNNLNGVGAEVTEPPRIHELAYPAITALQEAYVAQAVATVGDLDNVLYEISNENHPASTEWHEHLIRFIRATEAERGARHLIGFTFQYRGGSNATLFGSSADWISPNPDGGYRDDPPPADGTKVVINDTDHLWGIGGDGPWVWKSFLRGLHPIFMDPWDSPVFGAGWDTRWEPIRRRLGAVQAVAARVDLAELSPRGELTDTGYCLAGERELLVYQPQPGERFTVRLPPGAWRAEWLDPETGQTIGALELTADANPAPFVPPAGREGLMLLRR